MPEGTSNSLVNLGDLSKPADTLIKKVSKAVGCLFAPYQIKRIAKAEAEAVVIKAQSEIEITDLHRRAMRRFIEEEGNRQKNIEDITSKALPLLKESSDPNSIEDDWVTNFFDKSRIVSDQEMQDLWSRVLAGEANSPGSYSKRTVNFLSDLDKSDAQLFRSLLGFGWMIGDIVPLVFDVGDAIYNERGIRFDTLTHLESIGLIQFNNLASFVKLPLPKKFAVHYYGQPLSLEMELDSKNKLDIGKAILTKIGQELALICGSQPVEGFVDFVKQKWTAYLPKPKAEEKDAGQEALVIEATSASEN
jgi:hypothetical protein